MDENRNSEGFIVLKPKRYTMKVKLQRTNDPLIVCRHGHIAITNYKLGNSMNREFEKSLSSWNAMRYEYERVAGYYVYDFKEFRVSRGYNIELLKKFFPKHRVVIDNDAYPYLKADIHLLVEPRDDEQRVALSFLCSQGDFKKNKKYTVLMLSLTTGSGKTYTAIGASAYMQARTLIIVPYSKLLEQWKESYLKFTDLKESDIVIIRGSKICTDIMEGKYSDAKIFIALTDTINAFHKTHGDMETIEFFRSMNVYLKIVDEVHRDLRAISMIDALSNFRMNLYLSATPGRTDRKENWIFDTCYRYVPKFGANFKMQDEKHINVVIKYYRFTPTAMQISRMVQRMNNWLNSKSYERELTHSPEYQNSQFTDSLKSMLMWAKKLLKEGNKILILSDTIDGTEFTQNIAEGIFPGKTARYYGTMKSSEKEQALGYDIVCATISSLGTGADIPGIQFVLNIATYASGITAVQTAGRARKLKDGTQVWYIEFVNVSYKKTFNHFQKHKSELVKLSRTGKLLVVN